MESIENKEEFLKMQIMYLIVQQLDVEGEVRISEDMRLIEDFDFDSLQLINLILEIEKTFHIEFQDADMLFDNYNRIGDLCHFVAKLINKEKGDSKESL